MLKEKININISIKMFLCKVRLFLVTNEENRHKEAS
jgi:hypothetical protein